jgi:hypothetical protein
VGKPEGNSPLESEQGERKIELILEKLEGAVWTGVVLLGLGACGKLL